MKKLNSRDEDLNSHNISVVCEGAHIFKLSETKVRLGDGRASVDEIIACIDWVLDRKNSGYGSFKYACNIENVNALDEAKLIITRLFESSNKKKMQNYLKDGFDSFVEDLGIRFENISGNASDPLH